MLYDVFRSSEIDGWATRIGSEKGDGKEKAHGPAFPARLVVPRVSLFAAYRATVAQPEGRFQPVVRVVKAVASGEWLNATGGGDSGCAEKRLKAKSTGRSAGAGATTGRGRH